MTTSGDNMNGGGGAGFEASRSLPLDAEKEPLSAGAEPAAAFTPTAHEQWLLRCWAGVPLSDIRRMAEDPEESSDIRAIRRTVIGLRERRAHAAGLALGAAPAGPAERQTEPRETDKPRPPEST